MSSSSSLRSRIEAALSTLRDAAIEKVPVEKPLIMRTNYYENIRLLGNYLLFIYYAPYGHGKTVGVGLKLYHEALSGELKETHDVIHMQLRNLGRGSENAIAVLMQEMRRANVDPAAAFLAASLVMGLSANRCGSRVKTLCYSTYVERVSGNPALSLDSVINGLRREGKEYLAKLIERVRNGRTLTLVFDEFEALIEGGTFVPYNTPILDFLNDLGELSRWLHDKGVRKLKIVLLVQEAVIHRDVWKNLEKGLKDSAAWGTTILQRIDPYPARVYAEFVFEAVKRLVNKRVLYNSGWVKTLLQNKNQLIGDLEKSFVHLSRVPPRIAFSMADDYIATLAELATLTNGDIKELKRKIREAYVESIRRLSMIDETIRLQTLYLSGRSVYNDKGSLGNKENMLKIVDSLTNEVLGCGKWRAVLTYSTFYGTICVKGLIKKELVVDALVAKLKYSARSSVGKVAESFGKALAKKVIEAVESFIYDSELSERPKQVKIRIHPIVGRDSSTAIYTVMARAKPTIKVEVSKKLGKDVPHVLGERPRVEVELRQAYVLSEQKAIVLYAHIVAGNKIGPTKEYVERSYEEIINEMKALWPK